MPQTNQRAFTLVELIVVVTILAILGTIAFLSFQGYSKQARDSKRVTDVSHIKKSLELFSLRTGKYPLPDNGNQVSYSGDLLRTQGYVGENVVQILSKNLSKKPIDPLYNLEYVYSRTYSAKEYELMAFYEGDLTHYASSQVYAASDLNMQVTGTYNGVFLRTKNNIIPTPSIINAEAYNGDIELGIGTIQSQMLSKGKNIPGLSAAGIQTMTGQLDIQFIATGLIDKKSSDAEKISVINAIQQAYSGSILANNQIYANILSKNSYTEKLDMAEYLVLNTFRGSNNGNNENTITYEGNGNDQYTKLLIHSDDTNGTNVFYDSSSSQHVLTPVGATHSTSQAVFGGSSIYLPSGGITLPSSDDWLFGAEDFTIDYWSYGTASSNSLDFQFINSDVSTCLLGLQHYYGNMYIYINSSSYNDTGYNYPINSWVHNAIIREGNEIKYYANGVLQFTKTINGEINCDTTKVIGYTDASLSLDGFIDEFRISKGIARTQDPNDSMYDPEGDGFTPPSHKYGN